MINSGPISSRDSKKHKLHEAPMHLRKGIQACGLQGMKGWGGGLGLRTWRLYSLKELSGWGLGFRVS